MMRAIRTLAVLAALFLVLGVTPAYAEDDTGDTTDTTVAEEEATNGSSKLLMILAEGFDTSEGDGLNATEEDISAFAEAGYGFGELFKLNLYSTLLGYPLEDYLAAAALDPESGKYVMAWGQFKKGLEPEQLALLDDLPKNFGQLVSAAMRHHGRDEHQPLLTGLDADEDGAKGKAKGKNKTGEEGGEGDEDGAEGHKPDHAGKGGKGQGKGGSA
ncbi:MAG: hypothetical protein V3U47_06430 [Acidimicrobiia bacterium]